MPFITLEGDAYKYLPPVLFVTQDASEDNNDGSIDKPFQSIAQIVSFLNSFDQPINQNVLIEIIDDGFYHDLDFGELVENLVAGFFVTVTGPRATFNNVSFVNNKFTRTAGNMTGIDLTTYNYNEVTCRGCSLTCGFVIGNVVISHFNSLKVLQAAGVIAELFGANIPPHVSPSTSIVFDNRQILTTNDPNFDPQGAFIRLEQVHVSIQHCILNMTLNLNQALNLSLFIQNWQPLNNTEDRFTSLKRMLENLPQTDPNNRFSLFGLVNGLRLPLQQPLFQLSHFDIMGNTQNPFLSWSPTSDAVFNVGMNYINVTVQNVDNIRAFNYIIFFNSSSTGSRVTTLAQVTNFTQRTDSQPNTFRLEYSLNQAGVTALSTRLSQPHPIHIFLACRLYMAEDQTQGANPQVGEVSNWGKQEFYLGTKLIAATTT